MISVAIKDSDLELAYRYPFSERAKSVIKDLMIKEIDLSLLRLGVMRVKDDIGDGSGQFTKLGVKEVMIKHLVSYIYSRMIVSALHESYLILKYANSEALRATSALLCDSQENFGIILNELGIENRLEGGRYAIPLPEFLKHMPKDGSLHMSNLEVKAGVVLMDKASFMKFVHARISKNIQKSLPIPVRYLPKEVIAASAEIKAGIAPKLSMPDGNASGRYAWITRLLATPLADVRHRTVNLVLAPYFTNVIGLDEEKAPREIVSYIDRCKEINPDTRVNEAYIRYQCRYAKAKGLRPLSFDKAADMLGHIIDLRSLIGNGADDRDIRKSKVRN